MARRTERKSETESTLAELEVRLGHSFWKPELLTLALTHRSFVYDGGAAEMGETAVDPGDLADPSHDNEQLEFMGDAALGLLVAEALCQHFPASREGELTQLRATLVSRKHLGEVGTRLELGRWLRLGHTAEKNDGRKNAALFANAMEALIAALYLDGGLETARSFVEREILAGALPGLERSISDGAAGGAGFSGAVGDHKSSLQELVQAKGLGRPKYVLVKETGPDHRRVFRVEVWLDGTGSDLGALAEAEGPTKKRAQQEAARLAVTKLLERGGGQTA
jgi:ribonuclease-3